MQSHHEATLRNHISTLSPQERSNVKSHLNAAPDHDEHHPSAKTIRNWVGGIVGTSAIAGLSWKVIKSVVNKHI